VPNGLPATGASYGWDPAAFTRILRTTHGCCLNESEKRYASQVERKRALTIVYNTQNQWFPNTRKLNVSETGTVS
jgi:hypothetical protein